MTNKLSKELILYILYRGKKEFDFSNMDKLRIVKILYLLDRLSKETTGRKISQYKYLVERLGPLSWEILSDLSDLKREGIIDNDSSPYEFIIKDELRVEKAYLEVKKKIEKELPEKEIKKIFELAKNLTKLLDYVHALDEVKQNGLKTEVLE